MKKIVLAVALIFSASYIMAQEEASLQLYVGQKNWDKAKETVDKWVADPKLKDKEKPSAYLWKALIYSDLYTDSALVGKYPGADQEALDAFYQYQALDPELKKMKEGNFQGAIANVYNGYLTAGNEYWKAQKWDSAFKYFSKASRIGDMLIANKLTESQGDTTILLYTGFAAQNAKMVDSAAYYYAKVADMKVSNPEYVDIYKVLLQNASEKKDEQAFKKYLALAKELYPNDPTWSQFEMQNMTANSSLTELLQKYKQDAAAGPMTEDKLIGYAEVLATTDQSQLEGLDSTTEISLRMAAAEAFGKASDLNPGNGLYAFNTGVIYYGIYSTLDDRYVANRGESAQLKAARAEIAKQESAYADTASKWLEKAYETLKAKQDRSKPETQSLNRTVDYLANIYYWKREQTKTGSTGNNPDYDKWDALYKKFDEEHNSFQ